MKLPARWFRASLFNRASLLHLVASLTLLATTGCLGMPRMWHDRSTVAVEASGPPVWDDQPSLESADTGQDIAEVDPDAIEEQNSIIATDVDAADTEASVELAQQDAVKQTRPADRIASRGGSVQLVEKPIQFGWKVAAKSAGSRNIQSVVIGKGGFRTLLIGSIAGNDKVAVQLAERLAKHVYENQIVLGGIQLTVVRNLNPDGEAVDESNTDHGIYLNRQFPKTANHSAGLAEFPTEVQYLLKEIQQQQPQRVIHIRTIGREQGVVACSSGAKDVAADLSNWLGFEMMELPGRSVPGTLERYLSESDQCDMVTFAMPEDVSGDDAWDLYSDALLNLLMDEDFATRKLAREQKDSKAADRRNRKD